MEGLAGAAWLAGIFLTLGQCSGKGPACPQGKPAHFPSPDSSLPVGLQQLSRIGVLWLHWEGGEIEKGPGQNL